MTDVHLSLFTTAPPEAGLYKLPTGSPNESYRAAVKALTDNPERDDAWMLRGLISSIDILEGRLRERPEASQLRQHYCPIHCPDSCQPEHSAPNRIQCSCGALMSTPNEPHGCTVGPRGIDHAWAKRESLKDAPSKDAPFNERKRFYSKMREQGFSALEIRQAINSSTQSISGAQTIEYCIQSAPNPTTLTEHVRLMLKGGWVPQGGVCAIVKRFGYSYTQAMVRVGGGTGGATREDA